MQFDTYTIVLLVTRDNEPARSEAESAALQDAHMHHLATLHEQGDLLAAGPLMDPARHLRGLCIFRTDPERTRELAEADPAVIAGRFTVEVIPWMLPSGSIHFPSARYPHGMSELG